MIKSRKSIMVFSTESEYIYLNWYLPIFCIEPRKKYLIIPLQDNCWVESLHDLCLSDVSINPRN